MRTVLFHLRTERPAWVVAFAASVALLGCGSEGVSEGEGEVPAFNGSLAGGSSLGPGAGGAASSAAPGAGNAAGRPNSEPSAGTGTPLAPAPTNPVDQNTGAGGAASTGSGGSAAVGGSAGSSMVAAGGGMNVPTPAPGCEGQAFFCESFDALPLGALQGVVNGLQAERSVSVVAEAGRGQVLQVQAGPGYGSKAGVFLNGFAAPDNSYFGRMFARVAQFPTADGDHWVMVEATGNGGDQVRPVGGQFQRWAPGSDGPSAGDWTDWQQSNVTTVPGAWECVEWQMNGANGGNDISLWVDGVQVQPMDRGNFSFPAINRLWFGWVVYQMGQPSMYDVRLDDIALSTERIGCE